jgi:hypothetical protein
MFPAQDDWDGAVGKKNWRRGSRTPVAMGAHYPHLAEPERSEDISNSRRARRGGLSHVNAIALFLPTVNPNRSGSLLVSRVAR